MKQPASALPLAACVSLLACGLAAAQDRPAGEQPLFTPIVDLRLRSETVSQDGMEEDAQAITLRGRLGFETRAWQATSLLAEGEFLWPLHEDYNSTINGKSRFPVVADPRASEVNRLQLTNAALPGTRIVLGRQRIAFDDQRFVGNVGWRQNEQTFDALRVVNTSLRNVTVDVSWIDQVNRINGPESPVGRWHGDSYLVSVSGELPAGTITAFATVLEFDDAPVESASTAGLRFNGRRAFGPVQAAVAASYAEQRDRADNPIDFETQYRALALTGTRGGWSLEAGIEQLTGDGAKGFSTPLATLHRFQGWADKFLVTPPNGIDDRYVTATFARSGLLAARKLAATASYHAFQAERGDLDYGDEIDLQLRAEWPRVRATLKYADYRADGFATDTAKYWIEMEFALP